MKFIIPVIFLICSHTIQGQFSCDNIKLLGIYVNNLNTSQISLLMSNTNETDDGNTNVYTSFQIITDQGDTILQKDPCPCFILPNSTSDTIVYNLQLHENFRTIYELPDEFCGKIITRFPDCEITFCKNEIIYPDLPQLADANCTDYKVLGVYETANGGNTNYSILLTYTNQNYRGIGPTGYTAFEFFNHDQESISANSGPHYTMPQYVQDTIIIHLDFEELITSEFCGILKTTFLPVCEINYCKKSTSVNEIEARKNKLFFPNPTTGIVFVSEELSTKIIKIYNLNGQVVSKHYENKFDISQLTSGIYIVEIELINEEIYREKVLKY